MSCFGMTCVLQNADGEKASVVKILLDSRFHGQGNTLWSHHKLICQIYVMLMLLSSCGVCTFLPVVENRTKVHILPASSQACCVTTAGVYFDVEIQMNPYKHRSKDQIAEQIVQNVERTNEGILQVQDGRIRKPQQSADWLQPPGPIFQSCSFKKSLKSDAVCTLINMGV